MTKEEQEFERWFAEGVAFGFNPDDTVSLVPPPGAAEMVAQWLAREESTK
jgi:hypothetical protein